MSGLSDVCSKRLASLGPETNQHKSFIISAPIIAAATNYARLIRPVDAAYVAGVTNGRMRNKGRGRLFLDVTHEKMINLEILLLYGKCNFLKK